MADYPTRSVPLTFKRIPLPTDHRGSRYMITADFARAVDCSLQAEHTSAESAYYDLHSSIRRREHHGETCVYAELYDRYLGRAYVKTQ